MFPLTANFRIKKLYYLCWRTSKQLSRWFFYDGVPQCGVSRTHRVALGWWEDGICLDPKKSKSNTSTPKTNTQTSWSKDVSHVKLNASIADVFCPIALWSVWSVVPHGQSFKMVGSKSQQWRSANVKDLVTIQDVGDRESSMFNCQDRKSVGSDNQGQGSGEASCCGCGNRQVPTPVIPFLMWQTPWSRIRGQNSVYKEFLDIVGNGKQTGNLWKETIAVSATIWTSVEEVHHQIGLRILSCGRVSENQRGPEVSEVKALEVECHDGLARITLEEFVITHSVKKAPSRMLVLQHQEIVRLMNSRRKGLKR